LVFAFEVAGGKEQRGVRPPAGSPQLPHLFERRRAPEHGPSLDNSRPVAGSAGSRAGTYIPGSPRTRVEMSLATEASHLDGALSGLDFEDETVDRHHPDRTAFGDRPAPPGPGPPGGAPHGHDAVGVEVGPGLAELADHRVSPDRRDREPV